MPFGFLIAFSIHIDLPLPATIQSKVAMFSTHAFLEVLFSVTSISLLVPRQLSQQVSP